MTGATGIIITIAGTGGLGNSGGGVAATNALIDRPYGVSVDSLGNVYIADYYSNKIRKVRTVYDIHDMVRCDMFRFCDSSYEGKVAVVVSIYTCMHI